MSDMVLFCINQREINTFCGIIAVVSLTLRRLGITQYTLCYSGYQVTALFHS